MSATITLSIDKMSCGSCVGRVDRALAAVPGVETVAVNLATETAIITGQVTADRLIEASNAAGYPATDKQTDAIEQAERKLQEAQILGTHFKWAFALTLPVFFLAMGAHAFPILDLWVGQTNSWIAQGVLTTAVLLGPGRGFYQDGFPALIQRRPDMNSLVALGTSAAFLYSLVVLIAPDVFPAAARGVYFEAAAVIVTLILLGRWLEARAKGRTGAAIRSLINLQPKTAMIEDNETTREIAVSQIVVGNIIVLRPGERIPVDGEVLQGLGHVDEAMITGEPMPVEKTPGNQVTGGTINGPSSLKLRATRVGEDTVLAGIIRMVQSAQGAKIPVQALVDQITLWFVPAVMALALVTVCLWVLFGPAPVISYALVAGVSVLIIACPCAMGLATPTSIMVAVGRAAELGVLFRKGDALQSLSGVKVVAFDKTGTLTQGAPVMTSFALAPDQSEERFLAVIAGVETQAEHPLARAIVAGVKARDITPLPAHDVTAQSGLGISGTVDGDDVLIGSDRLMDAKNIPVAVFAERAQRLSSQGETVFYAAINGQIAGLIAVSDDVKPEAAAVIAALKGQGIEVAMITGDKRATAQAIAEKIGITHVVADVMPEEKVSALMSLRTENRHLAFVGDGINDAPALAFADVGIAIGTGTDVAIESADVVLMSGQLNGVVRAITVSKKTMRNIKQNLFWAFGYNVALIPVAAGALYASFGLLLSPMLAAGAMALSSVFVLSNALRLRGLKGDVS